MFCKGSKSYKEWDYDGGNGNYSHHRLSLNLNLGDFDSVIMRCCWCGLATGILREHQTHLNLPKSFYLCADSALVHYILYLLMMPFPEDPRSMFVDPLYLWVAVCTSGVCVSCRHCRG